VHWIGIADRSVLAVRLMPAPGCHPIVFVAVETNSSIEPCSAVLNRIAAPRLDHQVVARMIKA